MKVAALILAAGIPDRMESFQPLLNVGGTTIIRRQVAILREAGVEEILVITGFHGAMLERHLSGMENVTCIRNKDYANTHMLDSIRIGLNILKERCDCALILPADMPCVAPKAIQSLLSAKSGIAVPCYEQSVGHPVMISQSYFNDLIAYQGKDGLRGALALFESDISRIPVNDKGILLDINTDEDFDVLKKYEQQNRKLLSMELDVQVNFQYGNFLVEERLVELLTGVEKTGSLSEACSVIGMAYSKAWTMLRDAEQSLGYPMVERRVGGSIVDGFVVRKYHPEVREPISTFALGLSLEDGSGIGGPAIGVGSFVVPNNIAADKKTGLSPKPVAFWTMGSIGCEVEVNTETGHIKVLKMSSVFDAGKVINPQMYEGQAEGAMIQALGTALWEELKLKEGKVLNPSFVDYKIPTADDIPQMMVDYVEKAEPTAPWGARGIGEITMAPVAPAIANAVYNAIGCRFMRMPMTPDVVLGALRDKKEKEQ